MTHRNQPKRGGDLVQSRTAAASAALAPLFTGEPRRVEVVAALPVALHLAVAGRGGPPAVCLSWSDAVRLPSSVVLSAAAVAPPVAGPVIGAVGVIEDGRITLPRLTVQVTRWWRPPRPTLAGAVLPDALPSPPLDDAGTAAAARRFAAALTALGSDRPLRNSRGNRCLPGSGDNTFPETPGVDRAERPCPGLAGAVAALLGRGPGLTPLGDDVLAGALVTLRAAGAHRTADPLARPVLAFARASTTLVSASLLWHAARGECVGELAALLAAVAAHPSYGSNPPSEGGFEPQRRVAVACAAVLRLGHTSGAGLLHGVDAALRALAAARPAADRLAAS
jgi:hypothetical protein